MYSRLFAIILARPYFTISSFKRLDEAQQLLPRKD